MNQKKKNYGIAVTLLCCVVFFAGNYIQYQLSPLSGQVIAELGLNESQFSQLFTASLIPAIFLSFIVGILSDRFGARKTVGVALLFTALGAIGRIFAHSFAVMWLSMMVSGFAGLTLTASVAKILLPYFPENKIGGVVGIATSGAGIGMFVATATSALFPTTKSAYLFSAVLVVCLLVCWFSLIRKDAAEESTAVPMPLGKSLTICLKNRHVWVCGITMLLILATHVTISGFLPAALQEYHGMSTVTAGYMASAFMLGAIAGMVFGPRIGTKFSNQKAYRMVSAGIVAVGSMFFLSIRQPVLLAVILFICGAALNQFVPILHAYPVLIPQIGPERAATAMGIVGTVEMIGAAVVPSYILAPIFGGNLRVLFISAGCVCALAVITNGLLPSPKSLTMQEKPSVDKNV